MSNEKFTPGPDARLPFAGPHAELDDTNFDKGMPSVGDTLLYQLVPAGGLAFSRPFLVTSVDSRNQHVNGHVFTDPSDSRMNFDATDIPFGTPGQANSWHWPIRGYTGRPDAPQLTPLGSTEVVAEVPNEVESNAITPAVVPSPPTHPRKKHGS